MKKQFNYALLLIGAFFQLQLYFGLLVGHILIDNFWVAVILGWILFVIGYRLIQGRLLAIPFIIESLYFIIFDVTFILIGNVQQDAMGLIFLMGILAIINIILAIIFGILSRKTNKQTAQTEEGK